jgi:hypothetical protein
MYTTLGADPAPTVEIDQCTAQCDALGYAIWDACDIAFQDSPSDPLA